MEGEKDSDNTLEDYLVRASSSSSSFLPSRQQLKVGCSDTIEMTRGDEKCVSVGFDVVD